MNGCKDNLATHGGPTSVVNYVHETLFRDGDGSLWTQNFGETDLNEDCVGYDLAASLLANPSETFGAKLRSLVNPSTPSSQSLERAFVERMGGTRSNALVVANKVFNTDPIGGTFEENLYGSLRLALHAALTPPVLLGDFTSQEIADICEIFVDHVMDRL